MTEESPDRDLRLDEDQIRALIALTSSTGKSVSSMIREGIDMYLKVHKGEAIYHLTPATMLSPIVFDKPYRTFPPR